MICREEGILVEREAPKRRHRIDIVKDVCFFVFMAIMVLLIVVTATTRFRGSDPELFGYKMYVVESGSMSPTINVNSIIVVRDIDSQEVKEMDIICFRGYSGESTVTHRVVEVRGNGETFVTKGDANEIPDPMPVEASRLIGKVVLVIPRMGRVFRFLSTPLGLGMLVVFSCLWITLDVLIGKARKEDKQDSNEEKQL